CEEFKQGSQIVDGHCVEHPTLTLVPTKERNHFFRLSAYRDRLLELITTGGFAVEPEIRRNEVLRLLEGGLQDISISRQRQAWGIPYPGDAQQTVYVWFDALINYLSATGFPDTSFERLWPAEVHVIGKGITRFHCVIWPAMLMSAGVPLPHSILGHGWVHFQGEKLSKSLGNIVNPLDVAERWGADSLRYYLLKEVPLSRDGDFSWELFIQRYNSDLANDWGNLFTRTISMVHRYRAGKLAETAAGSELGPVIADALRAYQAAVDRYELEGGIEAAWTIIRRANRLVEEQAPWNLAKDPARAADLDRLLGALSVALQHVALLLYPIMPAKAKTVWDTLRLTPALEAARFPAPGALLAPPPTGTALGESQPLFPRIER
ncbi:MAG: class I tRNA ligase family protein, partial [Candidatus Eiseniibacteriota bacterium]